MLSVVMLSVIIQGVTLFIAMLSVVMLSVVKLNIVKLSGVSPQGLFAFSQQNLLLSMNLYHFYLKILSKKLMGTLSTHESTLCLEQK